MERGDFDSIVDKGVYDRIYFFLQEHEVAPHHLQAAVPVVNAVQPPKPDGVGVETP
jgi:hypothetical protein